MGVKIEFEWKDDDPRVTFLMEHLGIESPSSLFADMCDDVIDVWVDSHRKNDVCEDLL